MYQSFSAVRSSNWSSRKWTNFDESLPNASKSISHSNVVQQVILPFWLLIFDCASSRLHCVLLSALQIPISAIIRWRQDNLRCRMRKLLNFCTIYNSLVYLQSIVWLQGSPRCFRYHSVNNGGGMPIPQQQHFPANYMPQSQPYFPANNPAYRNTWLPDDDKQFWLIFTVLYTAV